MASLFYTKATKLKVKLSFTEEATLKRALLSQQLASKADNNCPPYYPKNEPKVVINENLRPLA